MSDTDGLDFVVGEESRLADLLRADEVLPLLRSAINAGLTGVELRDDKEEMLWSQGYCPEASVQAYPIFLEGEVVGALRLAGTGDASKMAGEILSGAINSLVAGNLMRHLTTSMHTKVVSQSYEELLEANSQLTESERRYRILSETLEERVRERSRALQDAYTKSIQQEKLAAVGQLAAGMAHEINNPLGFLLSNLETLKTYFKRLLEALEIHRLAVRSLPDEMQAQIERRCEELKLTFIGRDVPELLAQSLNGGQRVRDLVADLKGFSHVDHTGQEPVSVNTEIKRTLSVLSGEVQTGTEIHCDFAELPVLEGNPALFCQAFYNIILNALQIGQNRLELQITTRHEADEVQVDFADNGPGISPELRGRIFEPFFTTHDVGEGQGMGLAVAYDIVTAVGGSIIVDDSSSGGALFRLVFPVKGERHVALR